MNTFLVVEKSERLKELVKDGKNNSAEEKIRVGDKGRRRQSKKKWT